MIRAFVAIPIPDPILRNMESTSTRLKQLELDAKFTRSSAIHLTLRFLGDIDRHVVEEMKRALDRCVPRRKRFGLQIKGVGVFPNLKRPRIVWAGIGNQTELVRLQRDVEESAQLLGFESERRPFKPHLTLARLKSSRNMNELQRFLEEEGEGLRLGSFEVEEIHLYQSILHPSGAEYCKLSTHVLGPGKVVAEETGRSPAAGEVD